jgi:dTDP-4-amino-4,6-dideoxygalactose transaminase
MKEIYELGVRYGFKIIEDAAHAIGAQYYKKNIGNCNYSDITVYSFHPVKIITTGEGGAAMTNNSELQAKMLLLRSHGVTKDFDKMSKIDGPWYYEQIMLGYNYRMTDMQASLGISQLKRLDQYIQKRRKIALWYSDRIQNSSIGSNFKVLEQKTDRESSHHLFIIQSKVESNNADIHKQMIDMGIGVNLHYIPVYNHPNFKTTINLNGAESYYKKSMSLPIFPSISEYEKNKVVDCLEKILL